MNYNALEQLMQEYLNGLRFSVPPKSDDDDNDTNGVFGARVAYVTLGCEETATDGRTNLAMLQTEH